MSEQWTIWKDVCYPGRVHVPDARVPGKLHVYDFTLDDMKALEKTGNTKIGDNWNIPVCWEHQDVGPAQLSHTINQAKGVFARIRRFSRTPDGRLKAQLTGTDTADLKQLEKVGFVSPEIAWDWTDTDGRVWRGPSITHLAATPRPVQRHQNPFGTDPDRVPEALNRVNGLESLVRMSFGAAQKASRVAPTLRLSLAHYRGGLAIGASNMADDSDTGTTFGSDGKKSAWERIADSLAMCGVKIGDGKNVKDADHLADLVEVACLNRPQELPEEDEFEDEGLDDEGAPPPPTEGDMGEPPPGAADVPAPPIQMSQNALAQRLIAEHRAKLVARAEKVQRSGVLAPRDGDNLIEECRTCRLSLTANGDLTSNETLVRLAAFETARKSPAVNTGGAKTRLSQNANGRKRPKGVREVERSRYQENPATDADQIVEAWDQM